MSRRLLSTTRVRARPNALILPPANDGTALDSMTWPATSFRRGEWETELLASGRAAAVAVH